MKRSFTPVINQGKTEVVEKPELERKLFYAADKTDASAAALINRLEADNRPIARPVCLRDVPRNRRMRRIAVRSIPGLGAQYALMSCRSADGRELASCRGTLNFDELLLIDNASVTEVDLQELLEYINGVPALAAA